MGRHRLPTLLTLIIALICGILAQPAIAQNPPAAASSEDAARPFLGFWKLDEAAGDTAYINIKPRGRASVFWTGMASDKIEAGTYVVDGANLVVTWSTGYQEILEQPSPNVIICKTFARGAGTSGSPTAEARGERLDSRVPGSLTVPPTGPREDSATIVASEVNASALRSPFIGYWEIRQGTGSVLGIGGGREFFFLNLQRSGKAQAVQRNSWTDAISKQMGNWTVENDQVRIVWPSGHKDVLARKADGSYALTAYNEKQSIGGAASYTAPARQVEASGAQALFTAGETRLFTIEDFVGFWRMDDRKSDTRPHLEIERWGTASRFADPNNPSKTRETGDWKITQSGIAITWSDGSVDLLEISPTGYNQKSFAAGTSIASAPASSSKVRRISRNEVATAIAAGEARKRAEEVTQRQREAEDKLKAQAEARRKAEEDVKRLAAEEQHQHDLAEAQKVAAEKAEQQRIADAEAKRVADIEAARLAKSEAEARAQAEIAATARTKAEEESRRLAEAETAANRRAEEQLAARKKADADAEIVRQKAAAAETARLARIEAEKQAAEKARLAAGASAVESTPVATTPGSEKPATVITSTDKPAAVVVSQAEKQAAALEAQRKAEDAKRVEAEKARIAAAEAKRVEAEKARIAAEDARVRAEAELAAKQRAEADRRREEAIALDKQRQQEAAEQSRQRALADAEARRMKETDAARQAEIAKAREAESAARAKAAEQGRQRAVAEQAARPPQFVGLQPTASKAPLMNDLVWSLVWEDRFNETSLDTNRWNVGYPSKNIANNELSGYADDNVRLKDGALVVTARDKAIDYGGRSQPYTSGVITTFGKFEQAYGYFETRVRITEGKGLWPNFWLFSKGADAIRVLDIFGNEPDKTYHTVVSDDGTGTPKQRGFQRKGVDFSWEYHVVGVMWTPSAITFHVDGEEVGRITDNIPSEPMSVVLSMAVGGDLVGPPDGWTPFPAYYWVDWVRVYKLSE